MTSIKEAKERLLEHREKRRVTEELGVNNRLLDLNAHINEWCEAMRETFPRETGIEVTEEMIDDKLPPYLLSFLSKEFGLQNKDALETRVFASSIEETPAVTIAVVNTAVPPGDEKHIRASVTFDMLALRLHTDAKADKQTKYYQQIIEEHLSVSDNISKRNKRFLEYAEPILKIAQEAYFYRVTLEVGAGESTQA